MGCVSVLGCAESSSGGDSADCAADEQRCENAEHFLIGGQCYEPDDVEETDDAMFVPAPGVQPATSAVCPPPADDGAMADEASTPTSAPSTDCSPEEKMCVMEAQYEIDGQCYTEEAIENPEADEDEPFVVKAGTEPVAQPECFVPCDGGEPCPDGQTCAVDPEGQRSICTAYAQ